MKRIYILIPTLFVALLLNAQSKRANIWYFGNHAGLDFSTNPPTSLNNGKMDAVEGSSTICDTMGNLLFYTNGLNVWNRFHSIMPNGSGLMGSYTSTQTALIVPQPLNDSLYYVFTTDAVTKTNGLRYSIINTKSDSGKGDLVSKNQLLITPVEEKLCATLHENGIDIWITCHGVKDNSIYTFLLTKDGVSSCFLTSRIGNLHSSIYGADAQGQIKYSANGRFMAQALFESNLIEVFYFNNLTGKTESLFQSQPYYLPYGLEFSLSNKYLYISQKNNKIIQLNLLDSSIYPMDSFYSNIQGLQIAINGEIYLANAGSNYLASITKPDSSNINSQYSRNGISLSPNESEYSLPNFISNYFNPKESPFFYQQNFDSVFITNTSKNLKKWLYYEGSNLIDSSSSLNPIFKLFNHGYYTIKQILNNNDTFERKVLKPFPIINHDTTACSMDSIILKANSIYHCVYWNDTISSESLTVYKNGIYYIKGVDGNGISVADSINVTFLTKPTPDIGKDTSLCEGDSIRLQHQSSYLKLWNNGDTASLIIVKKSGIYTLTEMNGKCEAKDSAYINFIEFPNTYLGKDTSICFGAVLKLTATSKLYKRAWNTGDTSFSITVNKQGAYALTETNVNCSSTDSINITIVPLPNPLIIKNVNTLTTASNFKYYKWYMNGQPILNATSKIYAATQNGNYFVLVTDSNGCMAFSDTVGLNIGVSPLDTNVESPTIYPNPNNGIIHINIDKEYTVCIYNMLGIYLYSQKFNTAPITINACHFENGIYIIELTNSEERFIQKILIINSNQ